MKTIVRMDPFAELRRVAQLMDNSWLTPTEAPSNHSLLPLDVVEEPTEFVIRASVPGIKPEELSVTVEEGVLTLRGEHREQIVTEEAKVYRRELTYGSFTRSIRLPENVQLEKASATHEHGVLTLRLPKMEEPKPTAFTIPVTQAVEAPSSN